MVERSEMIEWMRAELVGPSRPLHAAVQRIDFTGREAVEENPSRRGPLAWQPEPGAELQEVLYYDRESPHRKYGVGLLHPAIPPLPPDRLALKATEPGADTEPEEGQDDDQDSDRDGDQDGDQGASDDDDFEVTGLDVRHPSTIGVSFCIRLTKEGRIVVRLPQGRHFAWQEEGSAPFPLNGRYELCKRRWKEGQQSKDAPVWRRCHALFPDTQIAVEHSCLSTGSRISREVNMPKDSPLSLLVELFPRQIGGPEDGLWLVTLVLRNCTPVDGKREPHEAILYQTYFEVNAEGGQLEKYPESQRPFDQLDPEEQSLALLYRESATWGIGHGCACGWDAGPGEPPRVLYADLLPAVQLPSMTPDITDADGKRIQLSMRDMAGLPDDHQSAGWQSLEDLAAEYAKWIHRGRQKTVALETKPKDWAQVAGRHLDGCDRCLKRIKEGIELLRNNEPVRKAFRLANLAMFLQQIATKKLPRRPLGWSANDRRITPAGEHRSPWDIYRTGTAEGVGSWRAFQIAFLLMSLKGISDGCSPDREVVDLIWFPTGGGKTEAYLAVMACYIFHERLLMEGHNEGPHRDGTNALMRYTMRMLTTQQFQRAASLICAMEFLRRDPSKHGLGAILGDRFSLGLWVGSDGSPNTVESARTKVRSFRRGDIGGNPLVLTECPWCRAEIGRYGGDLPRGGRQNERTKGISDVGDQGPLLHCPDGKCPFGAESWQSWLPVEVIDERIYRYPPSLVIGTADKFAIIAYRPEAGALFGRCFAGGDVEQEHMPPGLIVQDELHLISGPLGTMYALYEGIFERLCSRQQGDYWIKPKIIASTATIRGAADQVKALYARTETQLFPNPGLLMGDSFFGRYAREDNGQLSEGRLYLGVHASDYGSVLTTQVRAFSSALFRPFSFEPTARDPWWTLLVFYNSIRELAGARTLFDSDVRSRLKFLFNREGFPPLPSEKRRPMPQERRNLRMVEELTGRLPQAEIVGMMDRLSMACSEGQSNSALDACLASNIIEVGVDIERLSLMGVVGQPKTTAQYIQVTGRVGRRWWERPGLILMIYNPGKSRDRSHFEQFHSYHRRLYERVEPTSATPFALAAIQRALPGALIAWARQHSSRSVSQYNAYESALEEGYELLCDRCRAVQSPEDRDRALKELERVREELQDKWRLNPQKWQDFPPRVTGEYLMLWPGQFATRTQKERGVEVPSSMRHVDGNAELTITQGYV